MVYRSSHLKILTESSVILLKTPTGDVKLLFSKKKLNLNKISKQSNFCNSGWLSPISKHWNPLFLGKHATSMTLILDKCWSTIWDFHYDIPNICSQCTTILCFYWNKSQLFLSILFFIFQTPCTICSQAPYQKWVCLFVQLIPVHADFLSNNVSTSSIDYVSNQLNFMSSLPREELVSVGFFKTHWGE